MASPPFSLGVTVPGDSDIVSQFPLNERGSRDIIQSWLLANHDVNGNHPVIKMPYQGSTPATPAASIITVYADVNGRLKFVFPDATVGFVGLPPSAVIFVAKTLGAPVGYLVADGSAVSRSTYADLFAEIGVTYGSGDGSTTFNLPNIKGRVIAGEDAAGTNLSAAGFGGVATISTVGGNQTQTLLLTQIPTGITSPVSVVSGARNFLVAPTTGFGIGPFSVASGGASFVGQAFSQGAALVTDNTVTSTGTATSNNTSGLAHPNVQPTIILRALIKT